MALTVESNIAGIEKCWRNGGGAGYQLPPRGISARWLVSGCAPAAVRHLQLESVANDFCSHLQVMMGFISEWEPKLGVKIHISQVSTELQLQDSRDSNQAPLYPRTSYMHVKHDCAANGHATLA